MISMTITLKKKNGKLLKNLYCQNHKLGTEKVRVGNPLWYAAKCQEIFVIRQYQNDSGWVFVTGFFEEYIVFQTEKEVESKWSKHDNFSLETITLSFHDFNGK